MATIVGTAGPDNLTGTADADAIDGQAGDDILSGIGGDDTLFGSDGNDNLIGGAGADHLDGGAGFDTASYINSGAAVNVDLTAGTGVGGDSSGDTYVSVENLIGSAFDDVLSAGTSGSAVSGSDGNDVLIGGAGADLLDGGAGSDTASYFTSGAAVNVDLGANTGTGGSAAGDTYSGIENLIGSAFNDTLVAGTAAAQISGAGGDDHIVGSAGADSLLGNAGNDVLHGGAGADTLDGGDGSDFANYQGSSAGVSVDLLAHTASGGDAAGDV